MSADQINNPDFEPTIIRRPKTFEEKKRDGETVVVQRYTSGNHGAGPVDDLRKLEAESVKLVTPTLDMKLEIQRARVAKKMTQDQLDLACSFQKNTTKSYENGTAIVNGATLAKINRALGTNIKKPANKQKPIDER
jgi:hypothetical protein